MNTAPLEVTTHIAAPPEVVWPYLTDPARYALWMGTEVTLSLTPGGLYKVHMREGIEAEGKFVEIDPPRRLVFTWGWEDQETAVPPGTSTVEITLTPDGGGTKVVLVHRDLPEGQAGPHGHGWDHYMARLEIAGAGGDAGPDRGPEGMD